jgi:molecular chaperone GrpE
MSEPAPPAVAENAVERPRSLSREALAAALDDLGGWLDGLIEMPAPPESGILPGTWIDLHTVLAHFTALRHEINLQTKAVRAQQEQTGESLRQATQALKTLEASHAASQQAQQAANENVLRPLLQTLVELHDALARTGREIERALDAVASSPNLDPTAVMTLTLPTPEQVPVAPPLPWWARLFGVRAVDSAALDSLRSRLDTWRRKLADDDTSARLSESRERARQILTSVAAGYTMTLQRVERALSKHGLEAIVAVGRPYDPERMEAVEAVTDSSRPSGEVLDEVRRGYLYQGRVFRFAQVRVAKNALANASS